MGPFATRQVILLPFPFSDLSASKLRPRATFAEQELHLFRAREAAACS
jgi:hypothetical protein